MIIKELNRQYNDIIHHINEKRIKDAFDRLFILQDQCTNPEYKEQLNNHYNTLANILKYSFELTDDPEKEKIYNHLVKSLFELADDMKEDILLNHNLLTYYQRKSELSKGMEMKGEQSIEFIEKLSFLKEINQIISSSKDKKKHFSQTTEYRENFKDIFDILWLTDKYRETDISLVKEIIQNDSLPWYDKSVIVSAIVLSALRHFDSEKVNLLFDFYDRQEHQVGQRALIGIILILYKFDHRLNYYHELINRLKALQGDKNMTSMVESVIIQLIKAKETEKITKKIKEEILPEMWKIKSALDEKLNLNELLTEKNIEDKNPEWETMFSDSPDLYDKIEQFSNMQLEGSDVFMSAFAMLKRFSFFDEISNWFLPFYKENDLLESAFGEMQEGFDRQAFLEGLERTSFLCNSDKYSFCLNVKFMPAMQQSAMVELFNMELKAMNEIQKDDELVNNAARNKTVITQYIQDLYRFFKLHPMHKEFDDIFGYPLNFHHTEFFYHLIDDLTVLRNIGEFYFEKDYFKQALDIFLIISDKTKNHELFEKTAYCYQQLGEYHSALDYYHKAELIEKKKPWLLNKIAFCYRKNGNFKKAEEYYKESEKLDHDNLFNQVSLGNVHLDMEEYESALKYYFKVEYLAPDNHKVHRPIAWCSFLLGKFDTAKKYQKKVIRKEGNKNDHLNMGHILWCMGDKKGAIEAYKTSLKRSKMDFSWFSRVFNDDSSHLVKFGIPDIDIPLMIDYLKVNTEKS